MTDLETRVKILEHDIDGLKENLKESLRELGNDINEIKNTLRGMNEHLNELEKKLERKFATYNGYSEQFATKLELMEVKNKIQSIESEIEGRNDAYGKVGLILGAFASIVIVLQFILR